jgi:hypothetical protein
MRIAPFVLVGLLSSAPAVARAQEDEDPTTLDARREFVDGTALVRAQRWGEALAAFERAAKLKPHAITTYNIAQCERAMGQYTRARRGFASANAEDATADEKQLTDPVREEAKGMLRELDGILAKVRVTMRPEGAAIAVDGRPLERLDSGELVAGTSHHGPGEPPRGETFDLVMNPGVHVITVTRPGYQDVVLNRTFAPGVAAAPLYLELDRLPGSLKITSNVGDAIVRLNGADVGNPPVEVARSAGTYRVVVTRRTFVGYEHDVTLSPGQRIELAADLRKENPPITSKWWFWTGAVVILAGAATTTYFIVRSNEEPQRQPTDGGGLGWSLRVP